MIPPAFLLSLLCLPAADPLGPKAAGPAYVRPETPFGFLYRPEYDLAPVVRLPATRYEPQPGDVLLLSDTNLLWTTVYLIAGSGKPGHSGIVARMPDGRLGVLEAGYSDTLWTRLTPLDYRINNYPGTVWVRRRRAPLTPDQDAALTAFATASADTPYGFGQFALQITPFRSRGPIRTVFLGKPEGPGHRFFCAQEVIEAGVYAGLIDPRTARPSATFPRDIFFDRSLNPYIHFHPPLREGWEPPALWTPEVGVTAQGKDRPPVGVCVPPPQFPTRTTRCLPWTISGR